MADPSADLPDLPDAPKKFMSALKAFFAGLLIIAGVGGAIFALLKLVGHGQPSGPPGPPPPQPCDPRKLTKVAGRRWGTGRLETPVKAKDPQTCLQECCGLKALGANWQKSKGACGCVMRVDPLDVAQQNCFGTDSDFDAYIPGEVPKPDAKQCIPQWVPCASASVGSNLSPGQSSDPGECVYGCFSSSPKAVGAIVQGGGCSCVHASLLTDVASVEGNCTVPLGAAQLLLAEPEVCALAPCVPKDAGMCMPEVKTGRTGNYCSGHYDKSKDAPQCAEGAMPWILQTGGEGLDLPCACRCQYPFLPGSGETKGDKDPQQESSSPGIPYYSW